jgi:dsDNA-specific endonuclease/ATPase MutS2
MNSTEQNRKPVNDIDPEMERILREMLETNETITARAVARKHPAIGHASSITRIPVRAEQLARAQEQQKQFREWQGRLPKRSRDQLAAKLAQKDVRIAELEGQVETLRTFLLAMIRTVGELGGISKLLKLYEGYREARSELDRLGVLPHGEVKQFELPRKIGSTERKF